jgi:hypothetical protein
MTEELALGMTEEQALGMTAFTAHCASRSLKP